MTNLVDSLLDKDTMQVVSISLGFDLNPYIIKTKNKRTTWFAIESSEILGYLENLMLEEKPKFNLVGVNSNINDEKLITKLIDSGFNPNKKT
ncbi:MAG: class I SAM-dependent methyltransferase, partial [Candidatus Marsarchaeota archaeon]|nr:class I SAM-dependent methyltransferase [Candidatus Marsarchaeota archaeon]